MPREAPGAPQRTGLTWPLPRGDNSRSEVEPPQITQISPIKSRRLAGPGLTGCSFRQGPAPPPGRGPAPAQAQPRPRPPAPAHTYLRKARPARASRRSKVARSRPYSGAPGGGPGPRGAVHAPPTPLPIGLPKHRGPRHPINWLQCLPLILRLRLSYQRGKVVS